MLRLQQLAGTARTRAPSALSRTASSCPSVHRLTAARCSSTSSATAALRRRPLAPSSLARLRAPQKNKVPDFFSRAVSTKPQPPTSNAAVRAVYKTAAWIGIFTLVGGTIVLAFFIYDATTYKEGPFNEDIQVSELALFPRRGGPKNLPIAEHLVDDDDSPEKKEQKHKPKLVILGTGWGSIALLKGLNPDDYHITIVAPSNYFLFTPMLPSATVGTLELRSLVEPVRRIISSKNGHFFKGKAVDVEFSEKLVEVTGYDTAGNQENYYLPYDKLIVGVGKWCRGKVMNQD